MIPLILASLCALAPPALPAKAFVSAEAHFSIALPGTPEQEAKSWPTQYGPQEKRSFSLKAPAAVYGVMYMSVPEGAPLPSDESVLRRARDDGLASSGASVVTDDPISIDGHPGRQVVARSGTNVLHNRLYFVGGKALYSITIAFRENEGPTPAAMAAVFDSFRLLPGAAGTSAK